eukprot:CAMPEP_0118973736 /NCGR_PEP_ID=MMETSP1173-20130426/10841_1 /TAXON_ID=1034831 /ORGANISM="Rhizochromulina marina cf, Strain CCMP1243" /LENGTH=419 /DNA_ID=CAMNT_0006923429 /DNA_START=43 /DNA_END=1302 /DNA_ORIENTATION=+
MSTGMIELLGDTLKNSSGTVATQDALAGKVVGLYFSAHWCPPCRAFTPKLAEIHRDITGQGKNFEIVFVSSDRDEPSFDEYFSEMPWLSLPFEERDRKGALSKKFKVSGIPTLVLLNEDGSLISKDGRSVVSEDPKGAQFPWLPKPVDELIGDTLVGKDGPVNFADLKGKTIGLYFSAHWCGPCRQFTPTLADTYRTMKDAGNGDFEIIFVSSDRDEGSFNEYRAEMPWLALPFARRAEKDALSRHFGVEGIPTLVILDSDLKVVNKNARSALAQDPTGAEFPWIPKPVEELSQTVESGGSDVNEAPSLIALCLDMDEAGQAEVQEGLLEVAKETVAAQEPGADPELIFFTAKETTGPVPQVLRLMGLQEDFQRGLLLLDIPDNGGFYAEQPDKLDATAIRKFIASYKEGKLDRRQLSR